MFLTVKLCTHVQTELFKIELIICIKRLMCNKTQTTKTSFFVNFKWCNQTVVLIWLISLTK